MCKGCMTWGNRTRFGSGNNRAIPPNCDRADKSSLMVRLASEKRTGLFSDSLSVLRLLEVGWVRPTGRRWVESDVGNQSFINLHAPVRILYGEHAGETTLHLLPEIAQ